MSNVTQLVDDGGIGLGPLARLTQRRVPTSLSEGPESQQLLHVPGGVSTLTVREMSLD